MEIQIKSLIISILLLSFSHLMAQDVLSPRIANYKMKVKVNVSSKTLDGHTELAWRNTSLDTIDYLLFHMYYNAFKSNRSTFMLENVFELLPTGGSECPWGWTNIKEIHDQNGNNLTQYLQYIQTDNQDIYDESVLKIDLEEPILPGESQDFTFQWKAQIPKAMIRTGYNQDFYYFAQWFPKIGVYEPAGMRQRREGGWNCHQYHANGEFYSDFGNYDVEMDVPRGYIVGSSGSQISKKENGDRWIWNFKVDDVIDFSWTMSPHYIRQEFKWKDIDISLLTYPGHEHFGPRYFNTISSALEYFDENIGKYPYPTLTMVDPPIHGIFIGAMEYPTFINALSSCLLPKGVKFTETLIVHEFTHQYFMQMVATNETEEAWMDEGLTSYFESKVLDNYLGKSTSAVDFGGIKVGNKAYNRAGFFASENTKIASNRLASWEFKHGGYGEIAYNKTAVVLHTLEGLIGGIAMKDVMKTYFETWKFKHPSGKDFIQVVNQVVAKHHGNKYGEDMNWFFDQTLYGSNECDYSVANIFNIEKDSDKGYLLDNENCIDSIYTKIGDKKYTSKVILNRLGEITIPVEVKITFEDGRVVLEDWNGKSRSKEFKFNTDQKIISAEIDPEHKLNIERNFLNNTMVIAEKKKSVKRYLLKLISQMQMAIEGLNFFM
jgi:hypothetical protein